MFIATLTLCYFCIGLIIAFIVFTDIDGSTTEISSVVIFWPVLLLHIIIILIWMGVFSIIIRIKNKIIKLWYLSTQEEN